MDRYASLFRDLARTCPTLELRADEPMNRHTTFRIGGPVRIMALPKTEEEAEKAVRTALQHDVRPFYMGNGSDLLVSDRGYEGLILKSVDGLGALSADGERVTAGGGVLLSRLASFAMDKGLSGLEFAHGIPGSVGGAVTMNAGAYDGDMSMVVREVRCLSENGERETVAGPELGFSYRTSSFSDEKRLILGATLELKPGDSANIKALMDDFRNRRRHKQPLDVPSAGSTFKRPQGYFAASLIDECKLKGLTVGGAQVSKKHAGFLINAGGATCADVLRLADQVRETVLKETGVALELEIRTLGV